MCSRERGEREWTVAEEVELHLYGTCRHRDGDFEAVAADLLGVSQAEIDERLARERAR